MINPAVPVNSQQIHQLISKTNEKDMLFYEYEIVDKVKETKWAKKEARKYGLCLCSRWLFLLVGNAVLIAITCAICAILLYVNTPNDVTVKPLTYSNTCVTGSSNCDSLRYLVCTTGTCTCYSNRVWNGTDCACLTNQYWDGLACLTNQGYQQPCASYLPCYSPLFTCDQKTSTCLCSSTSTFYYTQYYTGLVTDLYTGTCQNKITYNTACTTYGVKSCMEWQSLTCSTDPAGTLICNCYNGYYWTGSACAAQGLVPGFNCTLNTNYACNSNTSMICTANQCACPSSNYFFHTGTGVCTLRVGYMNYCQSTTWCNTTVSLTCNLGGFMCNCPTTSILNTCDCASGYYWDGQQCTLKVALNSACAGQYACASGTCLYGYCL